MECPNCKGKTRVIDTAKYKTLVIRRRKCAACQETFYTEEKPSKRANIKEIFRKCKNMQGKRKIWEQSQI